jgi:hypothetical protein
MAGAGTDASQDRPPEDVAGSRGLGWLDWCGIVAAGLLVVILADIWTDGRILTVRLMRRRGSALPEEGGPDVRDQ